jgi:hypothetical protein
MTSDPKADAALEMAARLGRRQAAESAQAQQLVEQFVRDAVAAGISPVRFTARSYNGDSRFRTNVTGWYLKRDRSIGVGTDGKFYVLHAPGGVGSWVRGVTLAPSDPPLELGKGARDGESMPMAEALAKRLAGGNEWGKSPA